MNINYAIDLLTHHSDEVNGDLKSALNLAITALGQVNQTVDFWSNVRDTGWLSIDDVVHRYKLPKNRIKSRKWRIEHDFPKRGFDDVKGKGCRVVFHHVDVENWIDYHKGGQ